MRPIFGHFCRLFGYLLFVESQKKKKLQKKAHKTDVTTKEKEQQ